MEGCEIFENNQTTFLDFLVFLFRRSDFYFNCFIYCDSRKCYRDGFLVPCFTWIRIKQVDEVGTWLTDNMGIFFVPAGVGLMSNFGVLANTWWQLLIIMAVTTTLMIGFVGKVVQTIKWRTEKDVLVEKGDRTSA